MKPLTKEQFDANEALIKALAMFTIGKITNQEYVEIHNKARALLVNDSEPEKTPPSDVNPFFPYVESQDLKTHWNNPVDTVITSSEEPISWNGLKTYNPETHMLVPRVWSEEEKHAVRIAMCDLFNNSDLIPSDAYPIAITKVFGGEK